MKKLLSFMMLCVITLAGCSGSSTAIATGGSTSVEPLFELYMDEYKAENPDAEITYDAQGSSQGYEGIKNATFDIGFLSRELKEEEKSADITQEVIALDGISIIVNPENGVENLTTEQIMKIYTGEITNWSEVGGIDSKISVVSRDPASGTRTAFEEIIGFGGEEGTPLVTSATQYDSNGSVAQDVSKNVASIGYVSFATVEEVEATTPVKSLKVDGVDATEENVVNNKYPVSRPFLMIYNETVIDESTKNFITWIHENKVSLAEEKGYIAPQE